MSEKKRSLRGIPKLQKLKVKSGLPKFMITLSFSFIPALLTIVGLGAGLIYVSQTTQIDMTDEYHAQATASVRLHSSSFREEIDQSFSKIDGAVTLLENYLSDISQRGVVSRFPPRYVNHTEDNWVPSPEFSRKHNLEVDFGYTSYYVFNKTKYGAWTTEENATIESSSTLDGILPAFYSMYPEFLWVRAVYETGVVRTYPFYEFNISSSNPYVNTWYTEGKKIDNKSPTPFYYSEPTYDPLTGKRIVQISHPVYIEDNLEFVLEIDFDLSSVISLIKGYSDLERYGMIFNSDNRLVYHPKIPVGMFGWNETSVNYTISNFELMTENYTSAITRGIILGNSEIEILINGTNYFMSFFNLSRVPFYIGLIQTLSPGPFYTGFPLFDMGFIPALSSIITVVLFVLIQKKYGFFKGMTVEQLMETINSAADSLSELPFKGKEVSLEGVIQSAGELASSKIKEKGEEIRKGVQNIAGDIEEKLVGEDSLISKAEEILSGEEDILDVVEEKIDAALEQSGLSSVESVAKILMDKLMGVPENPGELFENVIVSFNLDRDVLASGDLDVLTNIPTPPLRMLVAAGTVEKISVEKLAGILDVESLELTKIFGFIPTNIGVYLDVDQVIFDNEKVLENLPELARIASDLL